MTHTVWKFELRVGHKNVIELRAGAKPVHVCSNGPGLIDLWVELDPDARPEPWTFEVFGTGHPIPDAATLAPNGHVGTAIALDGALVWHVYVTHVDRVWRT